MRLFLAASLVVLAGCSTHRASHSHDAHAPEGVVLASDAKAGGCHGKKAEMASTEGKKSCAMKAQTASADGTSCHRVKTADLAEAPEAHGKKGCAMKAEMASTDGKMCHRVKTADLAEAPEAHGKKGCAMKAEMASAEGKMCHRAKTAELAEAPEAHGKKGCAMKAEMASADGKMCHRAKDAEMAEAPAAEGATLVATTAPEAETHMACDACPKKADGTCDHEAGAQAGRECCQAELAKAKAN